MADYFADKVIFLVNAFGLFPNHFSGNISWYGYKTLKKENVKEAIIFPNKRFEGFAIKITNILFFHQRDPW